jgi:hypothetical protein
MLKTETARALVQNAHEEPPSSASCRVHSPDCRISISTGNFFLTMDHAHSSVGFSWRSSVLRKWHLGFGWFIICIMHNKTQAP